MQRLLVPVVGSVDGLRPQLLGQTSLREHGPGSFAQLPAVEALSDTILLTGARNSGLVTDALALEVGSELCMIDKLTTSIRAS